MSIRLMVPAGSLRQGSLVLDGDELRYAVHVRRARPDQIVSLFDGNGLEASARITELTSSSMTVEVDAPRAAAAPALNLCVAPALIKGERMDWAVTKLVELGVTRIAPMTTERTIVRLSPDRASARRLRFEKLAVAASRQSRRGHLPEISEVCDFADVLDQSEGFGLKLIPSVSQSVVPLREALPAAAPKSAIAVVGPEGGFTDAEVEEALAAGFVAVGLGPRVLRAETASIALAAILGFALGDVGRDVDSPGGPPYNGC